jgi:oxygen-independent coproporphyrinogen-3 oxidase
MPTPQHTASVPLPQADAPASVRGMPLPKAVWGDPTSRAQGGPPITSLYLHTPFCVHKCHYCDFYSFVDTRDQQEAFVDRLIDELRTLAPHAGPLMTIFVGGGTPSLLRVELWKRLLGAIDGLFDLSIIRAPWRAEHADPWLPVSCGEFTVECNPESASPELMHILHAGGVNRVSIGAQSFVDRHLKTLERWHNPDNVEKAIQHARGAGIERQSVDLIFAIPGQTLEEWDQDLRRALSFGTSHLSCYSLTYEPNTAMTKRLGRGEFEPAPEELEEAMFRHTLDTLRAAGLERYEVSNFARPGHESRHNIAYWIQEQWLGAGPSASSHVLGGPTLSQGSWRYKNIPRLGDYLASTGHSPVVDLEPPDQLRLIRERLMMGLRLHAGLDIQPLLRDLSTLNPSSSVRLLRLAQSVSALGHLTLTDHRWTLTDAGFLFCDGIAAQLMGAIPDTIQPAP